MKLCISDQQVGFIILMCSPELSLLCPGELTRSLIFKDFSLIQQPQL